MNAIPAQSNFPEERSLIAEAAAKFFAEPYEDSSDEEEKAIDAKLQKLFADKAERDSKSGLAGDQVYSVWGKSYGKPATKPENKKLMAMIEPVMRAERDKAFKAELLKKSLKTIYDQPYTGNYDSSFSDP